MNEQSVIDMGLEIIQQIAQVITGNFNIWIPVLTAWALAFVFSRRICESTNRKLEREFRIYGINFIAALALYIIFNLDDGMKVFLPQATLAGAVAVLLPAAWFRFRSSKKP